MNMKDPRLFVGEKTEPRMEFLSLEVIGIELTNAVVQFVSYLIEKGCCDQYIIFSKITKSSLLL